MNDAVDDLPAELRRRLSRIVAEINEVTPDGVTFVWDIQRIFKECDER